MIFFDTNYLIGVITAGTTQDQQSRAWRATGETFRISIIVWAEFLCGPITPGQLSQANALLEVIEPLTEADAAWAAELFNVTGRRRGSLPDCLIAATCMRTNALLATLNRADFQRLVPLGLRLV